MRRVCLLESDSQIAESLRRSLKAFSHTWELTFVTTAEQATAATSATDVLICGSLPEAEQVFQHYRQKAPAVVRIALAAADEQSDRIARLQALVHQVLRRPMLPPMLFDLVERTVAVLASMDNERVRVVIAQLGDLPPLPATYSKLSQMAQDPDISMASVASVVERDPAMSAAVLRTINSAYFGLPRRVSTVAETVRFLGIGPLKNLVLTVELFEGLAQGRRAVALQQEALLRAYAMRELLGRSPLAEQAFMAGILSDVGALLLVSKLPIDAMAIEKAVDAGRLPWVVEEERLGCTCASIGAKLLARWNMPVPLVEAVALRNEPVRGSPTASIGAALSLVHNIEWSRRAPESLRSEYRQRAAQLIELFPAASLESIGRYFGVSAEAA